MIAALMRPKRLPSLDSLLKPLYQKSPAQIEREMKDMKAFTDKMKAHFIAKKAAKGKPRGR